ncbi:MAG: outer membrane beta-barrel protein [Candidatus Zixiibacteriota bacterium]
MKRLLILLFGFMVVCLGKDTQATDLKGKLLLSGMGGASYVVGSGFSSEDKIKNNYGFGVSAEYFFLKPLSEGIAVVHNSFQGDWYRSSYPEERCYYSTDWNWTNISIFGRFVLGPENRISPYLKAGVGIYVNRIKDWLHYPPDTTYTHKAHGQDQFGWYFGFGIHCLLTKNLLLYLDVPFNVINTNGLEIHWTDIPRGMEGGHTINEKSYYFNISAGVSLLIGPKKESKKTEFR